MYNNDIEKYYPLEYWDTLFRPLILEIDRQYQDIRPVLLTVVERYCRSFIWRERSSEYSSTAHTFILGWTVMSL